ncbi:pheromone shutdown-related protein TraB [Treponema bryantii]|uniref:Pheromone shutdown-related protein TraB n=2 Tax=Treponema bryantii TaxID=163 RepID=A0A1H9FTF6_9SPIR|nr:TraB/GumN family protein [Treponema bryantii]BDC92719.1 conjugal transfer protein TraB [Treponema bryantii]SEQ41184.1 pheromone shutdown-related protein TraB [Treponema bryantii]
MGIDAMSQTQIQLDFNGRKITLVGTAHVSKESVEEVTETIKNIQPDCVAVELDEKRADSIKNPSRYSQLDLVKVLKKKQGFLLLANIMLSSYQRRMGLNAGVKPGDEMIAAMNAAEENNIRCTLVDRPIQITLKRAWGKNSFWGKCKLLATLISSAFSKEEVDPEEIEKLKQRNEMDSMMDELSDYMPVIKKVLIDERDQYLASKIWESEGNNIVAVLGAGHLPGVQAYLEKLGAGQASSNVAELEVLPKPGIFGKILAVLIPACIIGLIIAGFVYGGVHAGTQILSTWFLWNAIPAAILTAVAFGHPLAILVGFVGAPFTSLCPFIGIGFCTAIVQAIVCKPKVSDMENLQEDVSSLKGFYRNRILRTLLVFILSSLGSTLGTFIGGADIIGILQNLK